MLDALQVKDSSVEVVVEIENLRRFDMSGVLHSEQL